MALLAAIVCLFGACRGDEDAMVGNWQIMVLTRNYKPQRGTMFLLPGDSASSIKLGPWFNGKGSVVVSSNELQIKLVPGSEDEPLDSYTMTLTIKDDYLSGVSGIFTIIGWRDEAPAGSPARKGRRGARTRHAGR